VVVERSTVLESSGSSLVPSQSLSRPSHAAAVGLPATTLHWVPVPSPLHTMVPLRRQTPRPAEQLLPLLV
jgi:hypothetical protein